MSCGHGLCPSHSHLLRPPGDLLSSLSPHGAGGPEVRERGWRGGPGKERQECLNGGRGGAGESGRGRKGFEEQEEMKRAERRKWEGKEGVLSASSPVWGGPGRDRQEGQSGRGRREKERGRGGTGSLLHPLIRLTNVCSKPFSNDQVHMM